MNDFYRQSHQSLSIGNCFAALLSPEYIAVRRRILRQLVESLVYEGVVSNADTDGFKITIEGKTQTGNEVQYCFEAITMHSFGRVHMISDVVYRIENGMKGEAESVEQFLLEIQGTIGAQTDLVNRMTRELRQTHLKDTIAQHYWHQGQGNLRDQPYDAVESGVIDGHPYHPCYKSRIGFSIQDNLKYGPEFQRTIKPLWLAAKKTVCDFHIPQSASWDEWWSEKLGLATYELYRSALKEMSLSIDEYGFIPVHPWQFDRIISLEFSEEFTNKNLVFLGESKEAYHAQQSIRTLSNISTPKDDYLKLSLSIQNTSTSRILAPHTVANAPVISNWLMEILDQDQYLRETLRTVILRELAGASFHFKELKPGVGYGALSCIWRESIHNMLDKDEDAIPFSGLTKMDRDGRPLIDKWITEQGKECFIRSVLTCSVLPLIHFLYEYGIALESHAQNMVLIHHNGVPKRVALKDFHDGVRFKKDLLPNRIKSPELHSTPADHLLINRNSFIEVQEASAARDFMLDAFLFVNLSELSKFMMLNYDFNEKKFWTIVSEIICGYQDSFPDNNERYKTFDLSVAKINVEQLTKRRLFKDDGLREHEVLNPLFNKLK